MLVETENLVSTEKFRKELDKYVAAARQGHGPIAITEDSEIVGFFVGAEEYEAMFGAAVRTLLAARATGKTVSHEEVRARIRKITRHGSGK
jgi:PHD/YefM family antitoxin component YafN of YafNO toxin-antitoxin module